MSKILIRLRKKLWLPTKYKILRKKYIDELNVCPRAAIWDRLQDERKELIRAEMGLDDKEIAQYKTIINTLEWVVHASKE